MQTSLAATTVRPLEQLRAATGALHARLDAGAYARAVLAGTLSISRYARLLRALHAVHAGLELAIDMSGSAPLRAAYSRGAERRQRLERDLAYLQVDRHEVDAAVLQALVLAQRIRLDLRSSEAALFGHLYVLEGSQLGGLVQRHALAHRTELHEGGLEYLAGAGRETKAQFMEFVGKLSAELHDEASLRAAIRGAQHAFSGMEAIVEAVMSDRLEQPHSSHSRLASALNPDASLQPVPRDVREVEAALAAGEQSYRVWAYYEARYSERGLSFTRSDSAWLTTLARTESQFAVRHVHWLARVLAARGMPRLLMERHLELLHAALVTRVPEQASEYLALRHAAAELAAERRALLSDVQLSRLAAEFNPADEMSQPLSAAARPQAETSHANPNTERRQFTAREAGLLVVAAVLDEKRGIANAVESLCTWLGDSERFPPSWQQALQHTLSRARAAC